MQYYNIKIPLGATPCNHALCKKSLRPEIVILGRTALCKYEILCKVEKQDAVRKLPLLCPFPMSIFHTAESVWVQIKHWEFYTPRWAGGPQKIYRILAKGNLKHVPVWSVIKRKDISPHGAHEIPPARKAARIRLFYNGIIIVVRRPKVEFMPNLKSRINSYQLLKCWRFIWSWNTLRNRSHKRQINTLLLLHWHFLQAGKKNMSDFHSNTYSWLFNFRHLVSLSKQQFLGSRTLNFEPTKPTATQEFSSNCMEAEKVNFYHCKPDPTETAHPPLTSRKGFLLGSF